MDLIDPKTLSAETINNDGTTNVDLAGGPGSASEQAIAAAAGATADNAYNGTAGASGAAGSTSTLVGLLKGLFTLLGGVLSVGGKTTKVALTPTITAGAYAAGQVVGGLLHFANVSRVANGTGLITSASMASKTATTVQFDLILFSAQPTTSLADQAAITTVAAADLAKIGKFYSMTEWTAVGAGAFGQAPAEPRFFKCEDATNPADLWGYLVARAAITFGSTSDVTVTLRAAQD